MRMVTGILTAVILPWIPALVVAAEQSGGGQAPAEGAPPTAAESAAAEPLPEEYSCMFCHGKTGTLAEDEDTQSLIVTGEDLAEDIHWQKGLRCHDCHGGHAKLEDHVDHRDDSDYYGPPGEEGGTGGSPF